MMGFDGMRGGGLVVGTNKVKKKRDSMDWTIIWKKKIPRRPQFSNPITTSQKQPNGVRIIDAGEGHVLLIHKPDDSYLR